MNLQEAIEQITYKTAKFPKEAFQVVEDHPRESKQYLHEALDKATREGKDLDADYQLHFYGLFLLAEFQDREAFEKIMELVSLPPDVLDYLIGDAITVGLRDILYLTYNGNMELIKQGIVNSGIDEYARAGMLDVLAQLYVDGTLGEEEWKKLLGEFIHTENMGDYMYAGLAGMVCRCHFMELMKDVDYIFEEGLADESVFGQYDSCVDRMFDYTHQKPFCQPSLVASQTLKNWAMFEQEERPRPNPGKKDFEKLAKSLTRKMNGRPAPKVKIGRNDPCPCGSGMKYKQCCLNKPKEEQAESEQERRKWLKDYPAAAGNDREEGRIYLEDYFDRESIEIDQRIYLALKRRPGWFWDRETEEAVNTRRRIYLWDAFSRWVRKMETERIGSLDAYDGRHSIHYKCDCWLSELGNLLKDHGDEDKYETVKQKYEEYSR